MSDRLKMPDTRQFCDKVFTRGVWEKHGRKQTRGFAEHFHKHVKVPLSRFSMLDMGCALGDSLPVWKRNYPNARLAACDVSEVAIKRCQAEYGRIAECFVGTFEQIEGLWDVIYCSNVLEHFEEHIDIARALLSHCSLLYVLTPFNELQDGSMLYRGASGGFPHVATFYRNSFDSLIKGGDASRIDTLIFSAPGAWGHSKLKRVLLAAHRAFVAKPLFQEPLQIAYTIHRRLSWI